MDLRREIIIDRIRSWLSPLTRVLRNMFSAREIKISEARFDDFVESSLAHAAARAAEKKEQEQSAKDRQDSMIKDLAPAKKKADAELGLILKMLTDLPPRENGKAFHVTCNMYGDLYTINASARQYVQYLISYMTPDEHAALEQKRIKDRIDIEKLEGLPLIQILVPDHGSLTVSRYDQSWQLTAAHAIQPKICTITSLKRVPREIAAWAESVAPDRVPEFEKYRNNLNTAHGKAPHKPSAPGAGT